MNLIKRNKKIFIMCAHILIILGITDFGLSHERNIVLDKEWPVGKKGVSFDNPHGIAIDSQGNIFVADTDSSQILKFAPNLELLSSWEVPSPFGIAVDAADNIYVAASEDAQIQKFDQQGNLITKWGSKGTGTGQFDRPRAVAVDGAGNVYVADTHNNRVQKFTADGTYLFHISGDGLAQPAGIAFTANGDMYVSSYDSYSVYQYNSSGKLIRTYTGFDHPYGIAVDKDGRVLVAAAGSNSVRLIDDISSFKLYCDGVRFIAFDSNGFIYATSSRGNNVYIYDYRDSRRFGQIGTYYHGSADGEFSIPFGIDLDSQGNIYVADTFNNRIQKFDSNGNFLLKWGTHGSADGQFISPFGIAVDSADVVYVTDYGNDRIQKFNTDGVFLAKWGGTGSGNGEFKYPLGIAIDSKDNVYVTENGKKRIQKFDNTGKFLLKWENEVNFAFGFVAADAEDNIYIKSYYEGLKNGYYFYGPGIRKYNSIGVLQSTSESNHFFSGLAIDPRDGEVVERAYWEETNIGGIAFTNSGIKYVTNNIANTVSKILYDTYFYISGEIKNKNTFPIKDVSVTLQQGSSTETVTSDYVGGYQFEVPMQEIDSVITLSKNNYSFEPASCTYGPLHRDINQGFLATRISNPFIVSGYVRDEKGKGIEGAVVRLEEESTSYTTTCQSAPNGYYEFKVMEEGDYIISVDEKDKYSFYNALYTYSKSISIHLLEDENVDLQDFVGIRHKVSGYVRDNRDQGISNVVVTASNGEDDTYTTASDGYYEIFFSRGNSFTISASKEGYSFKPARFNYSYLYEDRSGQNFVGVDTLSSTGEILLTHNVANLSKGEKIILTILPNATELVNIYIYNLTGELIWEGNLNLYEGVRALFEWEGRNIDRERVASGIYLVLVHSASSNKKLKVGIVK